jgi:hypothetical protein
MSEQFVCLKYFEVKQFALQQIPIKTSWKITFSKYETEAFLEIPGAKSTKRFVIYDETSTHFKAYKISCVKSEREDCNAKFHHAHGIIVAAYEPRQQKKFTKWAFCFVCKFFCMSKCLVQKNVLQSISTITQPSMRRQSIYFNLMPFSIPNWITGKQIWKEHRYVIQIPTVLSLT